MIPLLGSDTDKYSQAQYCKAVADVLKVNSDLMNDLVKLDPRSVSNVTSTFLEHVIDFWST